MKKMNFKSHRILKAGVFLMLVAFISSCDWIDPELNIDPDSPEDVPMKLILPAIEQNIGFVLQGNNTVRTTSLWVQFYEGTSRQSGTEARYQLTAADVNNLWGSIYTEQLNEAKILHDKAVEEESPHNQGVAKILTAYVLGVTADLFNDIPYTEALKGTENNLTPIFDTQEQVYQSIFTLLDEALVLLASEDEPIGIDGDVIFDGNVTAWMMAAHSIYARAELQLSNVNGASAYTNALAHVTSAIDLAIAEQAYYDMLVPWENSNKNPLNQFMADRGDFRMCQTFLDELEDNADPRIPFLFGPDGDGGITGCELGTRNESASVPGAYLAAADAYTVLMSYPELKFIQAEALLSTDADAAADAYNSAVLASLSRITGVADQTWMEDNNIVKTGATITLEDIIMQKRVALVGQVQPYSDWRRTGIPALSMHPQATKTEIPRRFPYSQDESIYNPNVPSVGSIIDHVWWDQ